jgi:hypothetical protein
MAQRRRRSSITGRWLRKAAARRWPKTSITETVSDLPTVAANLRYRVTGLEGVMLSAAGEIRRWPGEGPRRVAEQLEQAARDRIPEETA